MHPQHSYQSQAPLETETLDRPLRIMLVESEPIVRLDMAEFLARCGHSCAQACTIGGALELIDGQTFDVALIEVNVDHQLTDPVLRALRAKGVPCVLVTAYTRHELPPAFAGLRLVEKPFAEHDLIEALHDCVYSLRPQSLASELATAL
jgi:CheY-like chemotaxis protein